MDKKNNHCQHCRLASRCLPGNINANLLDQYPQLQFTSHVLKPGEYLLRQGDLSKSLFAIRSGILKSVNTQENGKEFVMGFHLPPDLFGWEAIDSKQLSISVMALDHSNVCEIPIETLETLSREIPAIEKQLLQLVSKRIQHDNIVMLRSTAAQRVANFIVQLNMQYRALGHPEKQCKLDMTHQDIANYLRMTPETVSRTLHKFQSEDIIALAKKHIDIHNAQALKKLADVAA